MRIDRDNYEAWLLDRLEGRLTVVQERALEAFLEANPDLQENAASTELPRITADPVPFRTADALKRTLPPTGLVNAATLVDHLIARAEGDLDPLQLKALERYLYEHPEHERTARLVAASRVPKGEEALPERARLQKHFPPLGAPDRDRITDFLIAAHEGDLDAARKAQLSALMAPEGALQREERLVAAARVQPEVIAFPLKERLKKREARVVPLWSFGSGSVRWAAAASVLLVLGLAWWLLREGPSAGGEIARKQSVIAPVSDPKQPAPTEQAVEHQRSAPATGAPVQQAPVERPTAPPERQAPASRAVAPGAAPAPAPASHAVAPGEGAAPDQDPLFAQEPAPQPLPKVVAPPEPQGQSLAVAPVKEIPRGQATEARTVRELLAAGVRERVLDTPADARPLDRNDAVALADRGLKGLTGGSGGVEVERTAKRDRFRVRLGDGLAFSGSLGR